MCVCEPHTTFDQYSKMCPSWAKEHFPLITLVHSNGTKCTKRFSYVYFLISFQSFWVIFYSMPVWGSLHLETCLNTFCSNCTEWKYFINWWLSSVNLSSWICMCGHCGVLYVWVCFSACVSLHSVHLFMLLCHYLFQIQCNMTKTSMLAISNFGLKKPWKSIP